jgi:hypothetical protein
VVGVDGEDPEPAAVAVADHSHTLGDAETIQRLAGGPNTRADSLPIEAAITIELFPGKVADLTKSAKYCGSFVFLQGEEILLKALII